MLEFEDGGKSYFKEESDVYPFFIDVKNCDLQEPNGYWNCHCRIYQEKKDETRYNWLIKRGDYIKVSSNKYKNNVMAREDIMQDYRLLYKIEESAQQFPIEDKS